MNRLDLIITALEDRVKDYSTDAYDLDYYSCCSADLEAGHTTDCILIKALDAARELRRLHEINQGLVEALTYCRMKIAYMTTYGEWYCPELAIEKADAALAKATGESNE
jgi:hypothetical protein